MAGRNPDAWTYEKADVSYHEGYTTEYEEYIVEDGEIVVNMGAYSALVLKEMDVNYG